MNQYDYIVIGAGSAGCVVANRLTEDPTSSVLLLEAGGPDVKSEIHVPLLWLSLWGTEVDWAYMTDAEPGCNGRQIACPRGKVLGGSSSINTMIYMRGNHSDYDHWSTLGNPGWSYAEVLPYFTKSEQQQRGPSTFHGVDGPLAVTDPPDPHPFSLAFLEAAAERGYPRNADFTGAQQEGAGLWQRTIKDGKRQSTAVAFLHPIRQRPNLTIETHAFVTRLLFEGRHAVGVSFRHDGVDQHVSVRKEIILSAGAINSPQLLMLSGIGPAEALRSLGIPIVADLPGVGQNLQDHAFAHVEYHAMQAMPVEPASNHSEGGMFVHSGTHGIDRADSGPDLQFHFWLNWDPDNYMAVGFGLGPTPLRPQSRGQIRLRSADPVDPPLVQGNYLMHPSDMAQMVAGVKIARAVLGAQAMDGYRGEEVMPGASVQTDAAIVDYIRETAYCIWHPVGTCKMGQDPLAVVDSHLRVYGVQALRVVDASIMPTITSGNTNAPTIMIGEKGADMIKETASDRKR